MKYVISESKMKDTIENFITKSFKDVYKVFFTTRRTALGSTEGNPVIEETVINIIFDNSENNLRRGDMITLSNRIMNTVDTLFGLNFREYGSGWSFVFRQLAVVSIDSGLG